MTMQAFSVIMSDLLLFSRYGFQNWYANQIRGVELKYMNFRTMNSHMMFYGSKHFYGWSTLYFYSFVFFSFYYTREAHILHRGC